MHIQIAANFHLRRCGCAAEVNFMQQVRKYSTSRACHPGVETLGIEPLKGLIHTGAQCLSNGLQVVPAKTECISSEACDYSRL
jgi:hypothetical protein